MSEEQSDIAILMMLYNHEEWIEDTLHSLLSQTYKNFNLLVIDDASKDRSYELAKDIGKNFKNCVVVRNSANKGATDNFYNGLKEIERLFPDSQYFMWASPDDTWSPTFLEETRLKLVKNSKASVCQTGYEMIYMETGERSEHFLVSVAAHNYKTAKQLLLPVDNQNGSAFYNGIIQGLIRFSDLRSVFPSEKKYLSAMLCAEQSMVLALHLCGEIEIIDKIYYHRKKLGVFTDKYPNDPFSIGRNSVWHRLSSSFISSLWLLKLAGNKDKSRVVVIPLCVKLSYHYGIKFLLSKLKGIVRFW